MADEFKITEATMAQADTYIPITMKEMIANDMSVMDNAADGMADQLSSLGEALEIDNQ